MPKDAVSDISVKLAFPEQFCTEAGNRSTTYFSAIKACTLVNKTCHASQPLTQARLHARRESVPCLSEAVPDFVPGCETPDNTRASDICWVGLPPHRSSRKLFWDGVSFPRGAELVAV